MLPVVYPIIRYSRLEHQSDRVVNLRLLMTELLMMAGRRRSAQASLEALSPGVLSSPFGITVSSDGTSGRSVGKR